MGVIFADTSNHTIFCSNKCRNTYCSKHITKSYWHQDLCEISKLRYTDLCEGYIPRIKEKVDKSDA